MTSVVDPNSMNQDPDPIRIQGFDDQKLKKKYGTAENFVYTYFDQKSPP